MILVCFVFCVRAVNHPEYPSVLQALEIEDPVVANCLIDQRGIESILLIKVTSSFFTRKIPDIPCELSAKTTEVASNHSFSFYFSEGLVH